MPEPSITQMTLVSSATFLHRIAYLMSQQAVVVLAETHGTAHHDGRANLAMLVTNSSASAAASAAVMLAGSTNVIGTVVPNADLSLVDSSASDAALLSQIATLWNALAGIDTGT